MPEIIDLLSDSDNEVPLKVLRKEGASNGDGGNIRTSTSGLISRGSRGDMSRGMPSGKDNSTKKIGKIIPNPREQLNDSTQPQIINAVAQALKSKWEFGGQSEISGSKNQEEGRGKLRDMEKVKEKEKEMTEAEKIRELRLKRFGGGSVTSTQETVESTKPAVKSANARKAAIGNDNITSSPMALRPGKTPKIGDNVVGKENVKPISDSKMALTSGNKVKVPVLAVTTFDDSYGTFDFSIDDEDFPEPPIQSKVNDRAKFTASTDSIMKDLTQDTDSEDSFNDLPTHSKVEDSWKSGAFKGTGMKTGAKDVDCEVHDFSDPFRSSSPLFVPENPKAKARNVAEKSKSSAMTDGDDFKLDDSYDNPHKPTTKKAAVIDSDPFTLDDIYSSKLPEPKRRKVSNESSLNSARETAKETGGYRRTVSSIGTSSYASKPKASGLRRAKTIGSDDIVFTSSPDLFKYKTKKADTRKEYQDDDHYLDIDEIELGKKPSLLTSVSARSSVGRITGRSKSREMDAIISGDDDSDSDNDLPSLAKLATTKPIARKSATQSRDVSISAVPSPSRPKPKTKSVNTALEAYEKEKRAEKKAQDKARKDTEKAAAKEEAKEQKRLEKENKAREKERAVAFSKVNALKTDKKNSTPQMIVDLPGGLDEKLTDSTITMLGELGVEMGTWTSPIPNVIKFRRKVEADWDNENDCWRPINEPYIKREKHVLVIMKGEEFINLIYGEEGKDLLCHVLRTKAKFENDKFGVANRGDTADKKYIIYLIEGLAAIVKKNKNAINRRYTEDVRNRMDADGGEGSGNGNRRKRKADEVRDINEDKIEDALMELQVVHGVLVHQTAALVETAQWIANFTQHISTVPYRQQKSAQLNVCLDAGQIKSGQNPEDTFIKMLQETTRLTAPIAFGIAAKYPSATQLIDAFERAEEEGGRASAEALLEDLKKSSNADGTFTQGKVGKALSKRVWKVFLGRDEESCDV